MRPVVQLPEPSKLWVRFTPRGWPAAGGLWIHLGRGALGKAGGATAPAPRSSGPPLDDLLYLPPVPEDLAGYRNEVAAAHREQGTPVLVQLLPGEEAPAEGVAVYDPLAILLAGRLEDLGQVPAGAVVLWPLVPALTDGKDLQARGLEILAEAGAKVLQVLSLDLDPRDKRRLARHGSEAAYQGLFHRPRPQEQPYDRATAAAGLEPFLDRPLPDGPLASLALQRRLAGRAALAGELSLRLERSPADADALFRAARWLDSTHRDLESLVREGNLGIVPDLQGDPGTLVREEIGGEGGRFVAALVNDYLGLN